MGCPASKPAASAQKIVPYVGQVLSPLANSSRVLHNTTCFLNAWKIQTHPLAACPRVTMDAIIAPTASEGLDAEVRQASRRLLSLEELMGQQQGTEHMLHQHPRVLILGSFVCTLLGHCIVAAFLCLFWSSFFLRGSRRHKALSLVFTTMLLLQGGTAFLPAAEAAVIESAVQEATFATNPLFVSSAGASVRVYNAGKASPSSSAETSPPSAIGDALLSLQAPPLSESLQTKLALAGNNAALVHPSVRRLATTTVSPGAGTLQTAVNAAGAGDTLVLADGTYTGSGANVLEISKDITIRVQDSGQAILDGENTRGVISITSGTVTLEGLGITKGAVSFCPVWHVVALDS